VIYSKRRVNPLRTIHNISRAMIHSLTVLSSIQSTILSTHYHELRIYINAPPTPKTTLPCPRIRPFLPELRKPIVCYEPAPPALPSNLSRPTNLAPQLTENFVLSKHLGLPFRSICSRTHIFQFATTPPDAVRIFGKLGSLTSILKLRYAVVIRGLCCRHT
jgi:hypothetical protein